jgi:hypothetical protein
MCTAPCTVYTYMALANPSCMFLIDIKYRVDIPPAQQTEEALKQNKLLMPCLLGHRKSLHN